MSAKDLVDNIGLLAPGFILLKVLDLFGGQHRRLEWEWVVWSVVASLPIAGAASIVRSWLPRSLPIPAQQPDAIEIGLRIALALVVGAFIAWVWGRLKSSSARRARKLVRWFSDSAWDVILDEAVRDSCGVALTVSENARLVTYYGTLAAFGYETAGAEPWLYLTYVYRWDDATSAYVALDARTRGVMFHRTSVTRIRLIERQNAVGTS